MGLDVAKITSIPSSPSPQSLYPIAYYQPLPTVYQISHFFFIARSFLFFKSNSACSHNQHEYNTRNLVFHQGFAVCMLQVLDLIE
jgi:hypothetical protein